MRIKVKRAIVQYIGIFIGAIFFAIAYSWFLVPYKIAPGGLAGIAQIFYHLMNVPVGLTLFMINLPLFVISILVLGKAFGVRTFYGMAVTSVLTHFFSFENLAKTGIINNLDKYSFEYHGSLIYAMLPPEDIYLSAIAGSVVLGIGLGIIFRFKGSTAGTDIPVAIIKQKMGLSIGTGYWIVETAIILTVGIVFQDLKLIIWGYVNLFITAKITDITSEGLPYLKGFYIISEFADDIKAEIYNQVNRGVTFFKGAGSYSEQEFKIIFCVVNRRQVALVREIVRDIDPKAFVILTDVSDVMGYGFKSRNLDLSE